MQPEPPRHVPYPRHSATLIAGDAPEVPRGDNVDDKGADGREGEVLPWPIGGEAVGVGAEVLECVGEDDMHG